MAVHRIRKMSEMPLDDLALVTQIVARGLVVDLSDPSEPELSKAERALLYAERVGCRHGGDADDKAHDQA